MYIGKFPPHLGSSTFRHLKVVVEIDNRFTLFWLLAKIYSGYIESILRIKGGSVVRMKLLRVQ